jgi:hypothetical protein
MIWIPHDINGMMEHGSMYGHVVVIMLMWHCMNMTCGLYRS